MFPFFVSGHSLFDDILRNTPEETFMPYDRKSELPDSVRSHLPSEAQEIYRKAFNSAWDNYRDPEDRRGDAKQLVRLRIRVDSPDLFADLSCRWKRAGSL